MTTRQNTDSASRIRSSGTRLDTVTASASGTGTGTGTGPIAVPRNAVTPPKARAASTARRPTVPAR
ncbi:hypothetical protein [Streptomyces sp. NPDC088733]|uniref:hypothetical protein n=1 Tax=Streptomyces sp. NPDC088733 TaxID=3365880 RepID=UPI0038138D45